MTGVVFITGGGRGIGAATAVLLAERGYAVCLTYREQQAAAEGVAAQCADHGVPARAVRVDITQEADIRGAFGVAAELGTLTALVNNAGIVAAQSRVADMTIERVQHVFAVNVIGAFRCAREAVRRMSTANGGTGGAIVNVSSRAAVLGSPGEYVDYAASKGALDTFTTGLAREVADEGIRVNAVRPGLIETDIHASAGEPGRVERLAGSVPMGRGGRADEVAAAIAWLLSAEASYVTGTFLDVGGGR
ncbi:MAG: SDR family oxidoreductase [Actinomycetota bacterium]|nr:SDR family oxidoreductase [Actinomycetota bacterium]